MSMTRSTWSPKLKDTIDGLRPQFRDLSDQLGLVSRRRAEVAPLFMKAFDLYRRETRRPFIAFVHELDASVPVTNRKAYRVHPSYRAARYLQDLAKDPDHARHRGLTPVNLLAVTIKSFLPLCGSQKDQKDALRVLLATSKWRDQEQTRLLAAIRKAKAVGLPKAPRLVDVNKSTKVLVADFERDRLAS